MTQSHRPAVPGAGEHAAGQIVSGKTLPLDLEEVVHPHHDTPDDETAVRSGGPTAPEGR